MTTSNQNLYQYDWNMHLTYIDQQINNMWNFLVYDKFTDIKNKKLKDHNKKLKLINLCLMKNIETNKRKIEQLESKIPPKKKKN